MTAYLAFGALIMLVGLLRMSEKECAQIRNAAHVHGEAAVYVAVGCLLLFWPVVLLPLVKTLSGRS